MGVSHWDKTKVGQQIEFSALVKEYYDTKRSCNNYHLTNPDELRVLYAPALKIADPPKEEDESMPIEDSELKPVAGPVDALDILRDVKAFIRAVGGQEQATVVATALESLRMPISTLISWIRALEE
jgi:hypothetical protein